MNIKEALSLQRIVSEKCIIGGYNGIKAILFSRVLELNIDELDSKNNLPKKISTTLVDLYNDIVQEEGEPDFSKLAKQADKMREYHLLLSKYNLV